MTNVSSQSASISQRISVPKLLLHLEGLSLLIVAVTLYARNGASWWLFAVLLLAPDLSMLGYLGGPRLGSQVYNLAHTSVLPLLLASVSLMIDLPLALALALIWLTHIGMDRALGYGLKYASGFRDTHLERV